MYLYTAHLVSAQGYKDVVSTFDVNHQLISELIFTGVQTSGSVELYENFQLNPSFTICMPNNASTMLSQSIKLEYQPAL